MEDDADTAAAGGKGAAAADTEPKPAVTFKTEGEFLAAVEKRSKGSVSKAVDAARSEILTALGVESIDDLAGVKDRLASTEKTVSEAEKLKLSHDKTTKELEKERKKAAELSGRLVKIAKRDALLPLAAQVRDTEIVAMLVDPLLEVDEEGAVSVKDGRKLENVVSDLLKSRDFLAMPARKDGAGTTATEPRTKPDAKTDAKDDKSKADDAAAAGNGAGAPVYKTPGEKWVAELKARNAIPSRQGP